MGKDYTRRDFMKKVGRGTLALSAASVAPRLVKPARAATKDHILIGHPSSLTGPLAGLGEPTQWVNDKVVREINRSGGIYVKEAGKKLPVKVKIVEMLPQVMAPLDQEMAQFVHQELVLNGVCLVLGDAVESFNKSNDGKPVVNTKSGRKIETGRPAGHSYPVAVKYI